MQREASVLILVRLAYNLPALSLYNGHLGEEILVLGISSAFSSLCTTKNQYFVNS